MNENERAKRNFINTFHKRAEKRIKFLYKLYSEAHQTEAMTLCLSYIDGFSQWLLWPSDKTGKNFVDAIVSFGGDQFMALVHPLQAVRAFRQMKHSWKGIASCIEGVFPGPSYELQPQNEFISSLKPHLTPDQLAQLKVELWRTTTAAISYFHLRNPSIHNFGVGGDISFSGTTYRGSTAPVLNFKRLYGIALNIHTELRNRSEENGQWFGNDEIVSA